MINGSCKGLETKKKYFKFVVVQYKNSPAGSPHYKQCLCLSHQSNVWMLQNGAQEFFIFTFRIHLLFIISKFGLSIYICFIWKSWKSLKRSFSQWMRVCALFLGNCSHHRLGKVTTHLVRSLCWSKVEQFNLLW